MANAAKPRQPKLMGLKTTDSVVSVVRRLANYSVLTGGSTTTHCFELIQEVSRRFSSGQNGSTVLTITLQ